MKLYYASGTCSLATHIALREYGLPFELEKFDMQSGLLASGNPIFDVNGKGYVPVLELDDGQRITEASAVLQFIADQKPDYFPLDDPMQKYRVMEWLNFIATEIHKLYWPIFHGGGDSEVADAKARLARSFSWADKAIGEQQFVLGDRPSVPDFYLFTMLNVARFARIDMTEWPALTAFADRMRARPAVIEAMRTEGLLR